MTLLYEKTLNIIFYSTGMVHDAVLAWAYGVNKTLEQGYPPNDGLRVTQNIFNLTFEGITGTVAINEKGDRKPNYKVEMVQNGRMVTLMEWIAVEERMKKVYKPDDPNDWSGLIWPGNGTRPPTDSPPCGWDNELCPAQSSSIRIDIALAVIAVVCVTLVLTVSLGYRKIR